MHLDMALHLAVFCTSERITSRFWDFICCCFYGGFCTDINLTSIFSHIFLEVTSTFECLVIKIMPMQLLFLVCWDYLWSYWCTIRFWFCCELTLQKLSWLPVFLNPNWVHANAEIFDRDWTCWMSLYNAGMEQVIPGRPVQQLESYHESVHCLFEGFIFQELCQPVCKHGMDASLNLMLNISHYALSEN